MSGNYTLIPSSMEFGDTPGTAVFLGLFGCYFKPCLQFLRTFRNNIHIIDLFNQPITKSGEELVSGCIKVVTWAWEPLWGSQEQEPAKLCIKSSKVLRVRVKQGLKVTGGKVNRGNMSGGCLKGLCYLIRWWERMDWSLHLLIKSCEVNDESKLATLFGHKAL